MQNSKLETCQNCKSQFTIEPADFKFYEKMDVPPPTFCPECRLQRRLAWRNERGLYNRTCDKCKTAIISVFPADSPFVVYCRPCWWSDERDGLEYGVDFDPAKPFFLQVRELLERTPVMCLFGLYQTLQNSDYVNMASYLKNCYLLTHSDKDEDCLYGSMISRSKNSVDNLMLLQGERCYETVNCQKCYKTFFSVDCEHCVEVWFSRNCSGCSNCFGCANLKNKQYVIFNEPYSKAEYERKLSEFQLNSFFALQAFRKRVQDFWNKFPQKYIHERHNSSVSGDYLYNSKNARDSFVGYDIEDSRFCSLVTPGRTTNAYDFTHYGIAADLMYETLQCGNQSSRILFSWFALSNSYNVEYSIFAIGCKNIFGSVSLKKRQHCILNKQYSKSEYEALRAKIIEQMKNLPYKDKKGSAYAYGEFFPTELSPFGYNITTAQESFPLSEEEIKERGYLYKAREKSLYEVTCKADSLPEIIADVPDTITAEIIACGHEQKCGGYCTGAYRITPSELAFYRLENLPLPRLCPNCRFDERLTMRNPFRLWERTCQCGGKASTNNVQQATDNIYQNSAEHFHKAKPCPNTFETSYAPERKEIIYCKECYQSEIV